MLLRVSVKGYEMYVDFSEISSGDDFENFAKMFLENLGECCIGGYIEHYNENQLPYGYVICNKRVARKTAVAKGYLCDRRLPTTE